MPFEFKDVMLVDLKGGAAIEFCGVYTDICGSGTTSDDALPTPITG